MFTCMQQQFGLSLGEFLTGKKCCWSEEGHSKSFELWLVMEVPLRASPKPGLKVVRSREHIPMQERRGSEASFNNGRDPQVALVSCASAQSLQGQSVTPRHFDFIYTEFG